MEKAALLGGSEVPLELFDFFADLRTEDVTSRDPFNGFMHLIQVIFFPTKGQIHRALLKKNNLTGPWPPNGRDGVRPSGENLVGDHAERVVPASQPADQRAGGGFVGQVRHAVHNIVFMRGDNPGFKVGDRFDPPIEGAVGVVEGLGIPEPPQSEFNRVQPFSFIIRIPD